MEKRFLKIIIIVMTINLLSVTTMPHVYASENQKHHIVKYYVISDAAPVRCGPSKHDMKIATLGNGLIIDVQQVLHFRGQKSRWAKFKYLDYTAYINLKHLSQKPPVV